MDLGRLVIEALGRRTSNLGHPERGEQTIEGDVQIHEGDFLLEHLSQRVSVLLCRVGEVHTRDLEIENGDRAGVAVRLDPSVEPDGAEDLLVGAGATDREGGST